MNKKEIAQHEYVTVNMAEELSEVELDAVVGGGVARGLVRTGVSAIGAFGYGAACGLCPGLAVATPYVAGGLAAWSTAGYMKKGW